VHKGSLKISVSNDGEEQIIRFGYQHDFVVFLDAFLLGESSIFSIQALKKTTLSVIQREDFDLYIQRSLENLMTWNKILEGLVVQQLEREMDLLIASPYERFKRVLKRSPKLFQEIPHKHIANYLRMTPETLSRLKKLDFNQEK
jgi:CRP-like cAMP-binding protein